MFSLSMSALAVQTLAALVLCSGCTTYSVRRSALVPFSNPIVRTRAAEHVDVALQTPQIVSTHAPSAGDSAEGISLPRLQAGAGLRVRAFGGLELAGFYERGLAYGSHALRNDVPPLDDRDVSWIGLGALYSGQLNARWRLAVAFDFGLAAVPSVEVRTCVENCTEYDNSTVQHESSLIGRFSFAAVPSFAISERLRGFSSLTFQSHPTVPAGGSATIDTGTGVHAGPTSVIVAAGAEYTARSGLRASAFIHHTTSAPADYPVSFGAALSIPLVR